MDKPLISVIIPVFNVEAYLKQCVESVVNQTLKNIEIILVDDESPDNCPQLCDSFAQQDSRIKVIHKKNAGLGMARNSGIEVASGKYITFLDSDDYIDIDTYSTLYTQAIKENLDILYFCFERFNLTNHTSEGHNETDEITIFRGQNEIRNYMLDMIASRPFEKEDRKIQVSACCAIYRKDLITNNNIKFHSERELISEDLIFNIDVLPKALNIGFTFHSYYHYRYNPESLSKTIRLDRVDKNEHFYKYLSLRFKNDSEAILRCMRLFIGYARSSIIQVCNSNLSLKERYNWLRDVCKKKIWEEIYQVYPYKQLPFKYKLFFILSVYRILPLILVLSKLKK